jgi:hypothetical protein
VFPLQDLSAETVVCKTLCRVGEGVISLFQGYEVFGTCGTGFIRVEEDGEAAEAGFESGGGDGGGHGEEVVEV